MEEGEQGCDKDATLLRHFSSMVSLGQATKLDGSATKETMDYQLEQLINVPAGTHPALDLLMKGIAGGSEILFLGLIAL